MTQNGCLHSHVGQHLESQVVEDCIQLTESTYQRLRSSFECESRGKIAVKGKMEMQTYFLIAKRD